VLKFYSSSTVVVNSMRAITECLENALEGENNLDCDLIIFYTSIGHNFKDILTEARRLSPNAEIVGCTGAGVIGKEGPNESMKALAIMAIKGGNDEFAVAYKDTIENTDSYEMASQLVEDLKSKNPNINIILFHPSANDIIPPERAIEGIESVFGPEVPIIGSLSMDNMRGVSNFQFFEDQIFERGAVAVGFADPTLELISQASHGFDVIGAPFEVTRSEFPFIIELDGEPAWKYLTDRLGVPETSEPVDVVGFAQLAEELPEELYKEYGSRHILRPIWFKGEDGSILTPIFCEKGTKLWLTKRDDGKIFNDLDKMIEQLIERRKGRKPVAVFHADCALRGRFSFNRVLKDEIVSRMQYPLCKDENVPWLGMYGGGEFTMLGERNRIHFMTTSLYVILKKDV